MDTEIIIALISLAGIIVSAMVTKSNLSLELDKKMAVVEERLDTVDEHLRMHNHYSQLFAENMPVIKNELEHLNKRLDKVEEYEKRG